MKKYDRVIYKIINKLNNKFYIGQDSFNNPNYFGSGILIKKAINKYGIENFIKEIIDTASNQIELNEKETFWINTLNATDSKIAYNISKNPDHFMSGLNHTDEAKSKISKANLGNTKMRGKKMSDEAKTKISLFMKGRQHTLGYKASDETKNRMSDSRIGHVVLTETRIKISSSKTGKKLSDSHRQNIGKAQIGRVPWNKGMKMSDKNK